MQEAASTLESNNKIIKMLEEQVNEERQEVQRITNQLAITATQTPTDQGDDLMQELQNECYKVFEDARQQKERFESDLASKDAIIQQEKREFERLQDQCQRAERENAETH